MKYVVGLIFVDAYQLVSCVSFASDSNYFILPPTCRIQKLVAFDADGVEVLRGQLLSFLQV